jgi:hypothetical protein
MRSLTGSDRLPQPASLVVRRAKTFWRAWFYLGRTWRRNTGRPRSVPFFHETPADAETDKHLADRARKLAKMPKGIIAPASPRSVSFDKRNQCSASAIQRFLLAGSRLASLIHSAARALHSNWLDIGTPCLRVDLILANLRQVPFSDYCPQGHCPNGQVTLTERSGADRSHAESCLANRVCSVTIEAREIVRFRCHDASQSSRHRK